MSGIELAIVFEIFKVFQKIKAAADDAKCLPEMANRLRNRTLAFTPRIEEIQTRPDNFGHLRLPLQEFLDTTEDVFAFLQLLESRSSFRKVLTSRNLIKQHQDIQARLDRCRDDLQFQMVTDLRVEAQACEDDLRGLVQMTVEQQTSANQETLRSMMGEMLDILRGMSMGDADVMEDAQTVLDTPSQQAAVALQAKKQSDIQRLEIPFATLELFEQIGQGSFGSVYRALYNGTSVAVKALHQQGLVEDDKEREKALLEEVYTQSKCRSQYIAYMYGYSRSDRSSLYAVMELAPYGSLGDLIAYATGADGIMELNVGGDYYMATVHPNIVVMLLYEIALGMEFLHSKCVIHRDIKPRNILLGAHLKPKLTDFGLAREIQGEQSRTMTAMVGTYYYMAQELISKSSKKARYTYTADVYSYGAVIVEFCNKTYRKGAVVSCDGPLPKTFPGSLSIIKDRCVADIGRERYGRGSNEGILVSRMLLRVLQEMRGSPRQRSSPGHEELSDLTSFASEAANSRKIEVSSGQNRFPAGKGSLYQGSTAPTYLQPSSGGLSKSSGGLPSSSFSPSSAGRVTVTSTPPPLAPRTPITANLQHSPQSLQYAVGNSAEARLPYHQASLREQEKEEEDEFKGVYVMPFLEIFLPTVTKKTKLGPDRGRWENWWAEACTIPGAANPVNSMYTFFGLLFTFCALLFTILMEALAVGYFLAAGMYYLCYLSRRFGGPIVGFFFYLVLFPVILFLLLGSVVNFLFFQLVFTESIGLANSMVIAALGGFHVTIQWNLYIRRMCHLTRWAFRDFQKDWYLQRSFPPNIQDPNENTDVSKGLPTTTTESRVNPLSRVTVNTPQAFSAVPERKVTQYRVNPDGSKTRITTTSTKPMASPARAGAYSPTKAKTPPPDEKASSVTTEQKVTMYRVNSDGSKTRIPGTAMPKPMPSPVGAVANSPSKVRTPPPSRVKKSSSVTPERKVTRQHRANPDGSKTRSPETSMSPKPSRPSSVQASRGLDP